jgi:hypothetical protein
MPAMEVASQGSQRLHHCTRAKRPSTAQERTVSQNASSVSDVKREGNTMCQIVQVRDPGDDALTAIARNNFD